MTKNVQQNKTEGSTIDVNIAPDILTMAEAAQLMRCSKAHLSNVLNGKVSGLPQLPHIALGRRTLIRKVALERWLEGLEASANPR